MKISIIRLWSATNENYAVAEDLYGLQYLYDESKASWFPVQENSDIYQDLLLYSVQTIFLLTLARQ